jgi:hypothetical protein
LTNFVRLIGFAGISQQMLKLGSTSQSKPTSGFPVDCGFDQTVGKSPSSNTIRLYRRRRRAVSCKTGYQPRTPLLNRKEATLKPD